MTTDTGEKDLKTLIMRAMIEVDAMATDEEDTDESAEAEDAAV